MIVSTVTPDQYWDQMGFKVKQRNIYGKTFFPTLLQFVGLKFSDSVFQYSYVFIFNKHNFADFCRFL